MLAEISALNSRYHPNEFPRLKTHHFNIFVLLLRTVPTNSKVFLPRFMIMQEMLILTSVIEIQKENSE